MAMAAENLLDLNVDVLFEQQNVPNIDKEHRKIVSVIEDKREELRTLVGGRYRDLLQAADTITVMEESSSCLIEQLKDIANKCNSLNERQLIGFKSPANRNPYQHNTQKQTNNYFSNMLQIKLLSMLPDLIWRNIDKKNYSSAASLYILSRHISTGLRLDTQNPLQKQLPVGLKQWSILKSYYTTIKHCVNSELRSEHLDKADVDDHLLSLLLLDNSDLNAIFKTFLTLRSSTYLQCIDENINHNLSADKKRRVKERILASLKVLTDSIEILNHGFLEQGKLYEKLKEMSQVNNSTPLIALIEHKDVVKYGNFLPDVITNFRLQCKATPLDLKMARVEIEKWLNDIEAAQMELQKLIKQVTNMQLIQEIKKTAANYQKQHKFEHVVQYLQLEHQLDIFGWLYSPLLNKRFCEIIDEKWSFAIEESLLSIKEYFKELQNTKTSQTIWQEDVSEIPESLAAALCKTPNDKKLLMRTKGYNRVLNKICITFDGHAKYITGEIDMLMQEEETSLKEKNEILEYLCRITQNHISMLIESLRALEVSAMPEILFLCLYWTCLVELCLNLKCCVNAQNKWRHVVAVNKLSGGLDSWKNFCEKLQAESFYYWSQFLDNILKEVAVDNYLSTMYGHNNLLEDCVRWQTIESEQCNDENESVCSSFRIPSQPCISLQRYLFDLIGILNNYVPQTLPDRVLHDLHNKLMQALISYYQSHLPANTENITQNTALQMYFDLCFLQEMFGSTLHKNSSLKSELYALQQNCKTLVDPIDFELFLEHILQNVKLTNLRFNSQFGLLTSNHSIEQIANKEKNPNVLQLSGCNSTLWFSLLPIVNATQKSTVASETKNSNQGKPVPSQKERAKKNENTMSTSSSSSSFFW